MKKFLTLFFVLLLVVILGSYFQKPITTEFNHFFYVSSCDNPIRYHIGTVDPRFNLSKVQFQQDITQATELWDTAEGKLLFSYDPNAKFSVNLIYDQRQETNNQINSLENQVDTNKQSLNIQIENYKNQSAALKQKIQDLNQQIANWNAKGGAPEDVYNNLVTQQQELKQEADQLNAIADKLNLSTVEYNNQVGQLNSTINTFNSELSAKPEEGLFDPQNNTIDIYFNNSHNEIVHTFAHEFGHSLGLNHNQDKTSIMYPYTTDSVALSAADKAALVDVCQYHSLFEKFVTNFTLILDALTHHTQHTQTAN